MRNFVFMGTPALAIPALRALVDHPEVNLRGVVTQPDRPVGRGKKVQPSPVRLAAEAMGLPVLTPARIGDAETLQTLKDWRMEVAIVCAYGQIFPEHALRAPRMGCYNLHYSLLPRWRGASPIQAAILAGDNTTGVSLQKMVMALDAGPLVANSAPMAIHPEDTAETLGDRLARAAGELLRESIPRLAMGNPSVAEQPAEGVTFCKIIKKNAGAVDFATETAREIDRKLRAFTPWPGVYAFHGKKRLAITALRAAPASGIPAPLALGVLQGDGRIQTREGILVIERVKPAGKNEMSIRDYLNGTPGAIGQPLTGEPA